MRNELIRSDSRERSSPAPGSENPWLVIHIMKTAGTSLRRFLGSKYPGKIYPTEHELDQTKKEYLKTTPFLQLILSQPNLLKERQFVFGHFPAILTDLMPMPVRTATFLRDPVTRTISMIHHQHRYRAKRGVAEVSDLELLRDEKFVAHHIQNYQTKVFSIDDIGVDPNHPRAVSRADLDRAVERLERFDFIGLTERIDDSIKLFMSEIGETEIAAFPHMNRSPDDEAVDPSVFDIILKLTDLDREFYAHAQTLFQRHLEHAGVEVFGEAAAR